MSQCGGRRSLGLSRFSQRPPGLARCGQRGGTVGMTEPEERQQCESCGVVFSPIGLKIAQEALWPIFNNRRDTLRYFTLIFVDSGHRSARRRHRLDGRRCRPHHTHRGTVIDGKNTGRKEAGRRKRRLGGWVAKRVSREGELMEVFLALIQKEPSRIPSDESEHPCSDCRPWTGPF